MASETSRSTCKTEALDYLAKVSDGDARRALGALEIAVLSSQKRPVDLTPELAAESVQRKVDPVRRHGRRTL